MVELLEKMSGKHVLCNFSKKYEICSEIGCFCPNRSFEFGLNYRNDNTIRQSMMKPDTKEATEVLLHSWLYLRDY